MPILVQKLKILRSVFDPDKIVKELADIEKLQHDPDFWNDTNKAATIGKRQRILEKNLKTYDDLTKQLDEIKFILELFELDSSKEIEQELQDKLVSLQKATEAEIVDSLLSDKYDDNDAILTLHAGAGGTEAQDWVSMLFRMYSRYCERQGFEIKVLDYLAGDDAGIKSVSFLVEGDKAYGYLKAEKGVHRLVRISPFDANKRRHTSFASLDVMPKIEDDQSIVINPDDLKVDTYRSSGAGGQHVNKTESAIRITHIPTGIVVACQTERSQIQNRETAMKMLKSKLIALKEEERQKQMSDIEGDLKKIEWGSQIRSYVFCPYTLVKDHRTNFEDSNIQAVMDGDIQDFIFDYLKKAYKKNKK